MSLDKILVRNLLSVDLLSRISHVGTLQVFLRNMTRKGYCKNAGRCSRLVTGVATGALKRYPSILF